MPSVCQASHRAGVFLRQDAGVHLSGKLFENETRSIGGMIIEHQDFEIWISLPQQRLDACPDIGFFVPGWNEDRNPRRLLSRRIITKPGNCEVVEENDQEDKQEKQKNGEGKDLPIKLNNHPTLRRRRCASHGRG